MSSRDEFTKDVVRELCRRVASLCSAPDCRITTTGPHTDPSKSTVTGEAAHICAAAEGGPRYDALMTQEQRTAAENGIWLCCTCHTRVDRDWQQFPADLLRSWKVIAEREASSGQWPGNPTAKLAEIERRLVGIEKNFDRQTLRYQAGAAEALRAFVQDIEQKNPGIVIEASTTTRGTTFSVNIREGAGPLTIGELSFPDNDDGKRGAEKLRHLRETGRHVQLEAGEFYWKSNVIGLHDDTEGTNGTLSLRPRVPIKSIPVRLDIANGELIKTTQYANMSLLRYGTKEFGFGIDIPRSGVSLVFDANRNTLNGSCGLEFDLTKRPAEDALRGVRLMRAMYDSGDVSIVSLETGSRVFKTRWPRSEEKLTFMRVVEELLSNVVVINSALGLSFTCPRDIYEHDIATSRLIVAGIQHGTCIEHEPSLVAIHGTATKVRELIDAWRNGGSLNLCGKGGHPILFDQPVDVGEMQVDYIDPSIANVDAIETALASSAADDLVEMFIRHQGTKFEFLRWTTKDAG